MVIKPYSHYISEIIKILVTSLSGIERNPDEFRMCGSFNDKDSSVSIRGVGDNALILQEKIFKLISDYLVLNEITDLLIINTHKEKNFEVCFLLRKTFNYNDLV